MTRSGLLGLVLFHIPEDDFEFKNKVESSEMDSKFTCKTVLKKTKSLISYATPNDCLIVTWTIVLAWASVLLPILFLFCLLFLLLGQFCLATQVKKTDEANLFHFFLHH